MTSKFKMGLAGAFFGLTWGASLRAWMTTLALIFGDRPQTSWSGTFLAILLPAAGMGLLIGLAVNASKTDGDPRWRWAAWAPLLMVIGPLIFIKGFIPTLIETGLGGGAIAVTLIGLLGAHGFAGPGPKWGRWITGLLSLTLSGAMISNIYTLNKYYAYLPAHTFGALNFILLMTGLAWGASLPYHVKISSK